MVTCWKCRREFDSKKISFRDVCPNCDSDLHVCKNCKFYTLGKPNDCFIPGTEFVNDREKRNFCEDFQFNPVLPPPPSEDALKRARRLLGEDI